ncbi:MAG: DUF1549 domain-containing protein [Pirellulales bacterium]
MLSSLRFAWLSLTLLATTAVAVLASEPAATPPPAATASPNAPATASAFPADRPVAEAIDHFIDAKLTASGVSAAGPAPDGLLLRRTMLDLVGRIPTTYELQTYVSTSDEKKREQWVDRLMASPAFTRQQVDQFDTLLMAGTGGNLKGYLTQAFQENRPWNQMFRELMLGRDDDPEQKGALQFVVRRAKDLDKLTNDVSVLFFGVNVSCAQCHDHPLVEDWTQEHFYGMKSFFARTFDNGDFVGERDYGALSYKTKEGENRDASLMFLDGRKVAEPASVEPNEEQKKAEKKLLEELKKDKKAPPVPTFSRRAQLVETALQAGESRFFARSLVNQVWARFLGRGLVAPVDQMHSANPPSHPELLDWLANDFIQSGYDIRRLVRGIVLSRAYARDSVWTSNERPAAELFAVAGLRPLTPQQYAMLLRVATTNPEQFSGDVAAADVEKRLEGLEGAARGLAGLFEQPGSDFQVSIDEALLMTNGERIDKELLRDGRDSLVGKMAATAETDAALELAALAIFNRSLDETEKQPLREYVLKRADRLNDAYRQVVWAMLMSGECRFNY